MNQLYDGLWLFAGDRHVNFDRLDEPGVLPGIEVTAHALSLINRFGGHTSRPYSVAEHSLLVTAIAVKRYGNDLDGKEIAELAMACLMHDAHEAFVGDVPTPLKKVLGDAWYALENRVERAVRAHYDVLRVSEVWEDQVKQCDLIALATERLQLVPETQEEWPSLLGVEADTDFDLDATGLHPDDLCGEFTRLYLRLLELRSQGGLA